jgi:hypothetical protein
MAVLLEAGDPPFFLRFLFLFRVALLALSERAVSCESSSESGSWVLRAVLLAGVVEASCFAVDPKALVSNLDAFFAPAVPLAVCPVLLEVLVEKILESLANGTHTVTSRYLNTTGSCNQASHNQSQSIIHLVRNIAYPTE